MASDTDADLGVEHPPQAGRPWWQLPLVFILLPLGLLAPFGTTILGLMAISDIRHSMGRVVGLPLAVADTLLYPLLALDGLVVGLFALAYNGFDRSPTNAIHIYSGIAITIVFTLGIDLLIAVLVWRKAASSPTTGRAPPSS